jgi:REP element-mobilizing transposase RayT
MVRAFHVIFSAYGFWLPNDPRGSWSNWVGSWDLFRFGPATKTDARHSVAYTAHDKQQRLSAKHSLTRPPVLFTGVQAKSVGMGFSRAAREWAYDVHACAILPDHVHMVIGRVDRDIDKVVSHLKARATQRLRRDGLHPFYVEGVDKKTELPSPWARNDWTVFIDHQADIHRAIRYVERNPIKEALPAQTWKFVSPLDVRNARGKPRG